MNSQLYTAASGMIAEERRLELIANNLANLSTAGYRSLRSFFEVYRGVAEKAPPERRAANAAVAIAGTFEVPGPGTARPTGRALDVALPAEGLIAVRTEAGRGYTRAGSLAVGPGGGLIDALGHPVLDTQGQPIAGLLTEPRIEGDGRVFDGENEVGRMLVVRFDADLLVRAGKSLFSARGNDKALEPLDEPELQPGYLEDPAGDPVSELVQLIEAQRAFHSYQKIISLTMNEVNRRAVNDIAGR